MLALFLLAGPLSLQAGTVVTYVFTGQCSDCYEGQGNATATLSLQNYTPGDVIAPGNLVSFTYDGTDMHSAFTITATDALDVNNFGIGGSIPATLPAFAYFNISYSGAGYEQFYSWDDGHWVVGAADYGTNGTWIGGKDTVPEPGGLFLMTAGLAAIGLRRWKFRA
jgi:hypothetical protein